MSLRDIEDLLSERDITVSRETIRLGCIRFGKIYARRLKRKHRGDGDTLFIDEVFVKINGKQRKLSIKMAKLLMYFFKPDMMGPRLNALSNDCSNHMVESPERLRPTNYGVTMSLIGT